MDGRPFKNSTFKKKTYKRPCTDRTLSKALV